MIARKIEMPMTAVQVAKRTGYNERTVRLAIRNGNLHGHVPRGCKRPRFTVDDVNDWLYGGRDD